MTEKEELIAAMYQDEGEATSLSADHRVPDAVGFSRTRKIKVGIIEYEVPTIEYVNRLEQMLTRQAAVIERQERQIDRLKGFVLSTRSFIRRQTGRLGEMQVEIDGKLDYREYS